MVVVSKGYQGGRIRAVSLFWERGVGWGRGSTFTREVASLQRGRHWRSKQQRVKNVNRQVQEQLGQKEDSGEAETLRGREIWRRKIPGTKQKEKIEGETIEGRKWKRKYKKKKR